MNEIYSYVTILNVLIITVLIGIFIVFCALVRTLVASVFNLSDPIINFISFTTSRYRGCLVCRHVYFHCYCNFVNILD